MASLMDEILADYGNANASLRDRAAGARSAANLRLPVPAYPSMSGQDASALVRRDVFGPPTGIDPTLSVAETIYPQPNARFLYDPLNGFTYSNGKPVMPFRFSSPTTAADIAEERRIAAQRPSDQPGLFSRFGQAVSEALPTLRMPQGSVSGPSNPMGQLGSAEDQRAAFERMAGISAPTQPNYFTSMSQLGTPEQQRAAFETFARIQPAAPVQPNPLANPALNAPVVAGLDTTNRPAPMASSVTAPAREQGFFEKLFKGPQYQSNNMLLQAEGQPINFGDPNSAADFFRADALLRQQNPSFFGLLGGNNG
jgi:hypothetical protein